MDKAEQIKSGKRKASDMEPTASESGQIDSTQPPSSKKTKLTKGKMTKEGKQGKVWACVMTKTHDVDDNYIESQFFTDAFDKKEMALKWCAARIGHALYLTRMYHEGHNGNIMARKEYGLKNDDELVDVPSKDNYDDFCISYNTDEDTDLATIQLLPTEPPFKPEVVSLESIWPQIRASVNACEFLAQRLSTRKYKKRVTIDDAQTKEKVKEKAKGSKNGMND